MNIVVLGGGFVGQMVQLLIPEVRIIDAREEAPANHLDTRIGPQYLWEPLPGVPSESFEVTTLVDGLPPTEEGILAYKTKIGKENDGGDWGLQFQHKTTGWVSHLPKPRVDYNHRVTMIDLLHKTVGVFGVWGWTTIQYDLLVSTIPLPSFLGSLIIGPTYEEPFRSDPIWMAETEAEDVVPGLTLNYLSDPTSPYYRYTIAGTARFSETLTETEGHRKIVPGKIHPHRESESILARLAVHDCFCFGRFGTWRPDELAHQTWEELNLWKGQML